MKIYIETPFYGNPRMTEQLKQMGYKINSKRVHRLRKELGFKTVYPRPKFNTSEACPEHKKYPYLLRKLTIDHPNQVWATDITYTAVAGNRAFVILGSEARGGGSGDVRRKYTYNQLLNLLERFIFVLNRIKSPFYLI